MGEEPFEIEDLGEIAALPVDDARRRAVEATPRGRALMAAYREFLIAEAPPGSNPEVAAARLDAFIAREIEGHRAVDARLALGADTRSEAWTTRLIRALLGPALRPAFAAVVLLVVAGGAWLALRPSHPGMPAGTPVYRGSEQTPDALPTLQLERARTGADGALQLAWAAVPGATGYRLRFFGADLSDAARVDTGASTRWTLRREALPAGLSRGASMLWQVEALRDGDVIAASPSVALTLP